MKLYLCVKLCKFQHK